MMTYTFLEAFWCTYQNKQKSQFVCAVLDYVKRGFLRQKWRFWVWKWKMKYKMHEYIGKPYSWYQLVEGMFYDF